MMLTTTPASMKDDHIEPVRVLISEARAIRRGLIV